MDMLREHRTHGISLVMSPPLPAMRDMHRGALIRRASQTDHGHLNPHVHMSTVRYQVLQMASTETTEIEFPRHLNHMGPPFSHIVHGSAIHRHLLHQEHAKTMDSGLDQNRRAFQLFLVTVCLP